MRVNTTRRALLNVPVAPRTGQHWASASECDRIVAVAGMHAEAFARAVAVKDHHRIRSLLHADLDFRAMTPNQVWEASGPEGVVDVLAQWFEDDDQIEDVVWLDAHAFADRESVGYRLRVRNAEGEHLVEQQAYLTVRGDCIAWLRIMCSGYRRVP